MHKIVIKLRASMWIRIHNIKIYIKKNGYKNQSRREYENKYIKEIAKKKIQISQLDGFFFFRKFMCVKNLITVDVKDCQ